MGNGRSPQFRIGNGYDTDDLEEDWFWDIHLRESNTFIAKI